MLDHGKVERFIGVAPDFLVEFIPSLEKRRLYVLLRSGYSVEVTDLLKHRDISTSFGRVGLGTLCSYVKPIYGCSWCDLDSAVSELEESLRSVLEGRNVLLCYSGGKDSTLALLLLSRLIDKVSFRLHLVYIYIPFLDDPKGPDVASRLASKLGCNLEVIEAKRRDVRSYLRWRGLPRLGDRWCTQFKTRPVKKLAKELDALIVVADRATESPKRCRKLVRALVSRPSSRVRKLYIIAKATLLDVVKIVSEHDLVHPLYMSGATRISCTLCPFKSIYEYTVVDQSIEDEGLIESVLEKEYRRLYSNFVPKESFYENLLWRFSPRKSKIIHELLTFISRYAVEARSISFKEVQRTLSRLWMQLGSIPRVDLASITDLCSTLSS